MARVIIVVGDRTSSGGSVVSGSPETDIDGKPVARIGDMAACPLHKGVFPIASGDATLVIDGRPVAREGDRLACGCQLVSGKQLHVHVEGGPAASQAAKAEAPGSEAGASAPAAKLLASAGAKAPVCEECLLAATQSAAVFLGR